MGKTKKLDMFDQLLDPFIVAVKLANIEVTYQRGSRSVYDPYDWEAPSCSNIAVTVGENSRFLRLDISCNPRDGELILEVTCGSVNVNNYLSKFNKERIDKYSYQGENRVSTMKDFSTFLGYFSNHDDLVLEIVQEILDMCLQNLN